MEHSRCVAAGSPHSEAAVLAVHMRPTFDAEIASETGWKMTLLLLLLLLLFLNTLKIKINLYGRISK